MELTTPHPKRPGIHAGAVTAGSTTARSLTAGSATARAATARSVTADSARTVRGRDADEMAVASFVLGLVGLLVANVFLGPVAVVLALVALGRRTRRRGRAFLGLALGVADLVVLAVLVSADHTVSWSLMG